MRFLLFFLPFVLFAVPGMVFAANLSIFPESVALHAGDGLLFTVLFSSQTDINTVGVTVVLPKGLTFLSASDGNIVTQWIQHPTFNATDNTVSLSGIMPRGWSGKGHLASIQVAALTAGTYSLSYDKSQTEVYKNDGKATAEPMSYGSTIINTINVRFFAAAFAVLAVLYFLYRILRRRYNVTFV